jgi:hypothetical protein
MTYPHSPMVRKGIVAGILGSDLLLVETLLVFVVCVQDIDITFTLYLKPA